MNICCVYTTDNYIAGKKPLVSLVKIPFGISFIATSLKNSGYDVQILVITPETDIRRTIKGYIEEHHPRLFCLTSVSSQYPLIRDIARTVRSIDDSIYLLLGGHHASLNPEATIKEPCFDALCIGEGEFSVVEYASQIQDGKTPSQIHNLWIRDKENGTVEQNDSHPFIQDLDGLPFMDIKMWDRWIAHTTRVAQVLIGRGCPNTCTYCSNHALAKLCGGKYVRFRSPDNIIEEINRIIIDYPTVRYVRLQAETLSINLEYTYALCDRLKEFNAGLKYPLSFQINLSPGKGLLTDKEFLYRLKSAGIDNISIGLESGSEKVRNEILKRPRYTNRDIIDFCNLARTVGMHVKLNVLIGIPGETLSDFQETIACVRDCNPQHVTPFIFYPYPGTKLYNMARNMNLLSEDLVNPTAERKISRLDLPGFSKKQIQREFILFYYHVYRGRLPFYMIAARTIREFMFIDPKINARFKKVFNYSFLRNLRHKLSTDPPHHL